MRKARGFTIIELLVTIGIIAILLSIMLPSLHLARESVRRTTCQDHQGSLVGAWTAYYLDNGRKLVHAGTRNSHGGWVREGNGEDSLTGGKLWGYVENLETYKCPNERRGRVRSYSSIGFLNGENGWEYDPWPKTLQYASSIQSPSNQMVYMEESDPRGYNLGSWVIYPDDSPTHPDSWIDFPAVNHDDGDNLAFADGHVEFFAYQDERTIQFKTSPGFYRNSPNNQDLKRYQKHYIGIGWDN